MITSLDIALITATIIILTTTVYVLYTSRNIIKLFFECKKYDKNIGIFQCFMVTLRKANLEAVLSGYLISLKERLNVRMMEIETILMSNCNATNVLNSMALAKRNHLELPLKTATTLELSDKNSIDWVKKCLSSQRFTTDKMECQTGDGTTIYVSVTIDIQCNINNILSSYNEEYLFNKLFDSIFNKVYSIESVNELIVTKSKIQNEVLNEKLDKGCKYEIKSLEINISL